jgi:hypothetical protein
VSKKSSEQAGESRTSSSSHGSRELADQLRRDWVCRHSVVQPVLDEFEGKEFSLALLTVVQMSEDRSCRFYGKLVAQIRVKQSQGPLAVRVSDVH